MLHTVHNWHHAPIVRRTTELVDEGRIGRVNHVVWHTLRTRPAAAGDERGGNWRVDPAVAARRRSDRSRLARVLRRAAVDRRAALSVSATLERRRHTGWNVEDTASVRVTYAEATAEILLTWASDVRRNWAEVRGSSGVLELRDDTLVLKGDARGADLAWACPPAMSDGSHHPDWFDGVANQFLAEAAGAAPRGANLAEATLCAALERGARASRASPAGARCLSPRC